MVTPCVKHSDNKGSTYITLYPFLFFTRGMQSAFHFCHLPNPAHRSVLTRYDEALKMIKILPADMVWCMIDLLDIRRSSPCAAGYRMHLYSQSRYRWYYLKYSSTIQGCFPDMLLEYSPFPTCTHNSINKILANSHEYVISS